MLRLHPSVIDYVILGISGRSVAPLCPNRRKPAVKARGASGARRRCRAERAYLSVALTVISSVPSAREIGQFLPASRAACSNAG
jgi:hypothetical protein